MTIMIYLFTFVFVYTCSPIRWQELLWHGWSLGFVSHPDVDCHYQLPSKVLSRTTTPTDRPRRFMSSLSLSTIGKDTGGGTHDVFVVRDWLDIKVSPHQPSRVDETNPVVWSLWSLVVSIGVKHLETSHMKQDLATLFLGFWGLHPAPVVREPHMKLAKAKEIAAYYWSSKFYWSCFEGFLSKTKTQTEGMLIDKKKLYAQETTNALVGVCHSEVLTFWKLPQWSSCWSAF